MEKLYSEAEKLAGRPIEVEKTKDGKYIVLFLDINSAPPPKADTEVGALEGFIEWFLARDTTPLPEVDIPPPDDEYDDL